MDNKVVLLIFLQNQSKLIKKSKIDMLFQNSDAPVLQLFSLKEKVSLITGGSRGIGLAAAVGLAEAGSDIAITYNNSSNEYIKGLENQFNELGVKFRAYKCDISKKEQVTESVPMRLKILED